MIIKHYINGILKEENMEEGIVLFVGIDKVSMFNLISIGTDSLEPCVEKSFSLASGEQIRIKISQSELFDDACLKMAQFQGMKIVEIESNDVRVEIEC